MKKKLMDWKMLFRLGAVLSYLLLLLPLLQVPSLISYAHFMQRPKLNQIWVNLKTMLRGLWAKISLRFRFE